MWKPRRITTLWASTVCYREKFTFTILFCHILICLLRPVFKFSLNPPFDSLCLTISLLCQLKAPRSAPGARIYVSFAQTVCCSPRHAIAVAAFQLKAAYLLKPPITKFCSSVVTPERESGARLLRDGDTVWSVFMTPRSVLPIYLPGYTVSPNGLR
jgi:hypothetical protein